MEVKLELDFKKASKTVVAIAATYGLCGVSEGTKSPQLAAANALALIAIVAILYGPRPVPKNPPKQARRPTRSRSSSGRRARLSFPPFKGKPTDNDLTAIREMLLPILMEIPYDQLGGVHSLTAILTDLMRYTANHGGAAFKCPAHLPLYDKNIADDAMTVVCICAELAHRARLDDYASYKVAKHSAAKFLRKVVNEVWYNNLKDADTFYTKVLALKIMAFLDTNSRGLHAVDMITLRTNMHGYYAQADGIPQYIIMLEEAQKEAKRAGMPIADIELVMMALAAVLAVQHFPRKVNDWEGLPGNSRSWAA
jgi:hypothetical protein